MKLLSLPQNRGDSEMWLYSTASEEMLLAGRGGRQTASADLGHTRITFKFAPISGLCIGNAR